MHGRRRANQLIDNRYGQVDGERKKCRPLKNPGHEVFRSCVIPQQRPPQAIELRFPIRFARNFVFSNFGVSMRGVLTLSASPEVERNLRHIENRGISLRTSRK